MNLEIDREIKEKKKEEKLDISIKEFKEIHKESKKNILTVNKQIELIKDILSEERIKALEEEYKKLQALEETKNNLLKDYKKLQMMKQIIIEVDTKSQAISTQIESLETKGYNLANHFKSCFQKIATYEKTIKKVYFFSIISALVFSISVGAIFYIKENFEVTLNSYKIVENRKLIEENLGYILDIYKHLKRN